MHIFTFFVAIATSTLIAAELRYCCTFSTAKSISGTLECCVPSNINYAKVACEMPSGQPVINFTSCCAIGNPSGTGSCLRVWVVIRSEVATSSISSRLLGSDYICILVAKSKDLCKKTLLSKVDVANFTHLRPHKKNVPALHKINLLTSHPTP